MTDDSPGDGWEPSVKSPDRARRIPAATGRIAPEGSRTPCPTPRAIILTESAMRSQYQTDEDGELTGTIGGAWGVQVPHVNTADEARAAVDAVEYAPEGYRGIFSGG